MLKDVERIAFHLGLESQKLKTVEECNELIQAIQNEDFENIVEEIADVLIMVRQLIYLYDIKENVNEMIKIKIQRTLNRYKINENKITHKVKYFNQRYKFIEWVKQENPNIPERDLHILRMEALVEKYLPNWFIVIDF